MALVAPNPRPRAVGLFAAALLVLAGCSSGTTASSSTSSAISSTTSSISTTASVTSATTTTSATPVTTATTTGPSPTTAGATTATPPTSAPSTTTSTARTSTTATTRQPATMTVRVWFLAVPDAQGFRSVKRQVDTPAVAAGALDALFAGPTSAERASGLELVLSGATGYSHLRVENGIARVQLEGACASKGSTLTIAGEIFPILKQFSTVRWVKIYAPDGTTESPTGNRDSIPECLEP